MLDRRIVLAAMPAMFVAGCKQPKGPTNSGATIQAFSDPNDGSVQYEYPPLPPRPGISTKGIYPPNDAEKAKAADIIKNTTGNTPLDVAQSFVDRFAKSDPQAISQWPRASHWNPLVVTFFEATDYGKANDMVAWCAAFVNWCVEHCGKRATHSASSQSFVNSHMHLRKNDPIPGDVAVFTDLLPNGKSSGSGHVTFFKNVLSTSYINVVGGNQAFGGHSSIISEKPANINNYPVTRTIGNRRVACTRTFAGFVTI